VLDRRGVDVFFGVGMPPFGVGPGVGVYSADNVAGDPGWVLVFRAVDQAVYVRREGGVENLARAARFYRERGVPFDLERGLDTERALREAPAFARSWRLLPRDDEALALAAASEPAAGETLAQAYAAVAAWPSALAAARQVLALDPASRPARRCLVYALLRTGRPDEALEEALALVRLEPADRQSRLALTIARRAATGASAQALGTLLLRYPLLDHAETLALLSHYESASLRRARGPDAILAWP
jgi:tetratricopeptide (TPR) repeat protein